MEVQWRTISDFPNYEISNRGEVRNIKTKRDKALRKDKDGYLTVALWKDNKEKNVKVHRLVAYHFVDGYFEGAVVNHKDEIRDNNTYTNLEWCDVQYNNTYNDKHRKRTRAVNMYDKDGRFIREFESLQDVALHFNKRVGNLCSHLKGRQKTYAGHIFRYKEDEDNE